MDKTSGQINTWIIAIAAIVIVAVVGVVLYLQTQNRNEVTVIPEQNQMTETPPSVSDDTSMMEDENIQDFELTATNFGFSQKEMRVKVGDTVRVTLTAESGMHDWVIDEFNARTQVLSDGEAESVVFVADQVGEFEYYCSVPNHREMGMVGKLIVEE